MLLECYWKQPTPKSWFSINIQIYEGEDMISGKPQTFLTWACLFGFSRDAVTQRTHSFQIYPLVLESRLKFLKLKEFTVTDPHGSCEQSQAESYYPLNNSQWHLGLSSLLLLCLTMSKQEIKARKVTSLNTFILPSTMCYHSSRLVSLHVPRKKNWRSSPHSCEEHMLWPDTIL